VQEFFEKNMIKADCSLSGGLVNIPERIQYWKPDTPLSPLLVEGTVPCTTTPGFAQDRGGREEKFPSRKRGARLRRAGCVIHQMVEKFFPASVIFSKPF